MIPLPFSMEAEFNGAEVTCSRYEVEHLSQIVAMERLCFPMPWRS